MPIVLGKYRHGRWINCSVSNLIIKGKQFQPVVLVAAGCFLSFYICMQKHGPFVHFTTLPVDYWYFHPMGTRPWYTDYSVASCAPLSYSHEICSPFKTVCCAKRLEKFPEPWSSRQIHTYSKSQWHVMWHVRQTSDQQSICEEMHQWLSKTLYNQLDTQHVTIYYNTVLTE